MTEGSPSSPSLPELLNKLELILQEPLDFSRTDPETTERKVLVLSAAATYFNTLALTEFGGRVGPEREPGLVEQVVAAAFQSFGGVDPHPQPFDKAAMLLRGILTGFGMRASQRRPLTLLYETVPA